MSSGGSSVELQTYDRHIQTFAATDQPDNPLDHEDYEADGTFGRPKNTQPLLPSSGSPVRVAIKRKPVSSTGFYSRSNTEARPSSTSISGTISEIEPVRIESMIRNPVNIDGEVDSIHTEKDVSNGAPEGWPASPMTITKPSERNSGRVLEICSYVFMGAMALGFLVFAILCASMNNTYPGTNLRYTGSSSLVHYSVDTFPLNIDLFELAKVGPTILPILFAGIVGSSLRLLARWKAERGWTIQGLETLIQSRSLAAKISTLCSLRSIGLLEVGLIAVWAMSPLAGQASLRIVSTSYVKDATWSSVWSIINTTSISTTHGQINFAGLNTENASDVKITSDYFATVSSFGDYYNSTDWPNPYGAIDANAFPVLPMTANDEPWTIPDSLPEAGGWFALNYTSLLGLPLQAPDAEYDIPQILDVITIDDDDGQAYTNPISYGSMPNFTISMFEFKCLTVSEHLMNSSWTSLLGSSFIHADSTPLLSEEDELGPGFFLDTNYTFGMEDEGPQNVLFGSFHNSKVTLWSCSVSLNTRWVSLFCSDNEFFGRGPLSSAKWLCYVSSMGIPTLSSTTLLNDYIIAANTFGQWPILDAAGYNTSSVTERYIASGANLNLQPGLVDLSSIDNITFSSRLTTIFNTWYLTLQIANGTLGYMNSTQETPLLLDPFELFACNWFWFTVLVVVAISLILCSALNIWLLRNLSTPDILGSVSCLTIENPYVSIQGVESGSGSALDGLQRARLLGNMNVQIRDMQPEEQFGKFALTTDVQARLRAERSRKFI